MYTEDLGRLYSRVSEVVKGYKEFYLNYCFFRRIPPGDNSQGINLVLLLYLPS